MEKGSSSAMLSFDVTVCAAAQVLHPFPISAALDRGSHPGAWLVFMCLGTGMQGSPSDARAQPPGGLGALAVCE